MEKNSKGLSRRDFINKTGKGIAGSYFLASTFKKAEASQIKEENQDNLNFNETVPLNLIVNGKKVKKMISTQTTLAEFLRNKLQLTGTKIVCNHGECGGCTVIMDKKAIYSCQTLALDAEGKEITTIEGLMNGEKLNKVQEAFIDKDGLQCGFCTPGQIMAAYALLLNNPNPSKEEILTEMSGNICRCAAYPKIFESVEEASKLLREKN
jgi:xanthine dehydrogenase YagT iron-sulfur-binding subunit